MVNVTIVPAIQHVKDSRIHQWVAFEKNSSKYLNNMNANVQKKV